MKQQTNIAIYPNPGISHLIPLVELAKRLIALDEYNFHFTFFISNIETTPRNALQSPIETLPEARAETVFLPPVSFDPRKGDTDDKGLQILLALSRSLPSLRNAVKDSPKRFAALFVEPFGIDALSVAKELGVASYVFIATNAWVLSFFLRLPDIDEAAGTIRFMRDLPEPVKLPGCPPINGADLFTPLQDRTSKIYAMLLQISKRLVSSDNSIDGFVVNTFDEMEPEIIKSLKVNKINENRFIYPVGPVQDIGVKNDEVDSECLAWLDKQPRGSVIYVSFGSGGTLSRDQTTELALGLEMSGQRFLWVARKPNDDSSSGAYLKNNGDNQSGSDMCLEFLPIGFLEWTKEIGLVVLNWAPQAQILAHSSTGGFLTHCGAGATLEAVSSGVPMIAWPLFAEQHMNAVVLAEGLRVALRPKSKAQSQSRAQEGFVVREEVSSVVKALMSEEGKEVRERMIGLKEAAFKALGPDGTTTMALSDLAFKLTAMNR